MVEKGIPEALKLLDIHYQSFYEVMPYARMTRSPGSERYQGLVADPGQHTLRNKWIGASQGFRLA